MTDRHGQSYTKTYCSWKHMRQRCTNPNYPRFEDWGGKGVDIDPRWQRSFSAFYTDMGDRPDGMTLDRIDNSRGYWPDNCRWATAEQQRENRKCTIYATINGTTQTLKQWAKIKNVSYQTLYMRIDRGMTPEEAINTPVKKRPKRR